MPTTSTDPNAPPSKGSEAKQLCYVSTPKHINSFIGRFIYIYTGKGTLDLTPKSLVFTYRNGALMEIPLNAIRKLERGSYSRVAKPFGLDFIAVTYESGHNQSTICLTPTRSALTPTWETNKIVTQWMEMLQRATDVR